MLEITDATAVRKEMQKLPRIFLDFYYWLRAI